MHPIHHVQPRPPRGQRNSPPLRTSNARCACGGRTPRGAPSVPLPRPANPRPERPTLPGGRLMLTALIAAAIFSSRSRPVHPGRPALRPPGRPPPVSRSASVRRHSPDGSTAAAPSAAPISGTSGPPRSGSPARPCAPASSPAAGPVRRLDGRSTTAPSSCAAAATARSRCRPLAPSWRLQFPPSRPRPGLTPLEAIVQDLRAMEATS